MAQKEGAVQKVQAAGVAPGGTDLFAAQQKIKSSHTSELVIALCGPIGSPLHRVAETIEQKLTHDFGYQYCKSIRMSRLIEEQAGTVSAESEHLRIKKLISQGDDLRESYGNGVLAELAVRDISIHRQESVDDQGRFHPVRVCHIIDSIKNQEELDVLRLVYRDMLYSVGVFAPLDVRIRSLKSRGMKQSEIFDLIDQDSGEETSHGQTVRDTFPQSDFFLRIDSDADSQIETRVERFLHLILGTKVLTPSSSETAMYLAASAAGNSACLSRQVGAALTDSGGEVIAIGWNDVPKAGGGLYAADPKDDPNGDRDKRCWNLHGGTCFNDQEKKFISDLMISTLIQGDIVPEKKKEAAIKKVLSDSRVKDLIEFSRAVHAEMHAILSGSQLAGDRVRKGKLYCTTYPCHSCARHIIAAGISEVYYIEPYRKSLATKLHGDDITEDETDKSKVRILPYDGVSPNRYLQLFRVPGSSRKIGGKMIRVDTRTAAPRFNKTLEALPALEALVIKGLQQKKLVPDEEGADA